MHSVGQGSAQHLVMALDDGIMGHHQVPLCKLLDTSELGVCAETLSQLWHVSTVQLK